MSAHPPSAGRQEIIQKIELELACQPVACSPKAASSATGNARAPEAGEEPGPRFVRYVPIPDSVGHLWIISMGFRWVHTSERDGLRVFYGFGYPHWILRLRTGLLHHY
jgi:hypothetical protein